MFKEPLQILAQVTLARLEDLFSGAQGKSGDGDKEDKEDNEDKEEFIALEFSKTYPPASPAPYSLPLDSSLRPRRK